MTHEEKTRIVAEYMGLTVGNLNGWMTGSAICAYRKGHDGNIIEAYKILQLKYHTSLDWLNPVWVKIRIELSNYQSRVDVPDTLVDMMIAFRDAIALKYYAALSEGDIAAAFDVVVEAIEFINKNKKG